MAKILCRSYQLQPGTNVVKSGSYGSEGGDQICSFKRNQQDREHKNNHKSNEVYIDRTDYLMLYQLSVHFQLDDTFGMNIGVQFLNHRLKQNYQTGYLYAATGTSGTATNKH